ncbi:MAG TPA: hypothetical protein VF257_10475 [Solirubrobacteraceae bacterium]
MVPRSPAVLCVVLGAVVVLCSAAPAQATIVPQQGIKGIRLGMTVREVRDRLGTPDKIAFRRDPIQGRIRIYAYGLTRASFSPGEHARVNTISTTSRHERTSRGIGVGSRRALVARRVPGVRCRVEFGTDHCSVGIFTAGRRVTDFLIGADGRVRRVTVGFVID